MQLPGFPEPAPAMQAHPRTSLLPRSAEGHPSGNRHRKGSPDLLSGMERVQCRTDGGDQDIRCSVERLGKSNP